MSANDRIQWLHKKISERRYPSIAHIMEKFSISRRQAQRDVDQLKSVMGAPVAYSPSHKGYYYTESFSVPTLLESESDADFGDVLSALSAPSSDTAQSTILQLQFPYTAELEIKDKMTILNLRKMIVSDEPHHRYICQFPSVELFIGLIMSTGADIKIIKPDWLRERLVEFATRVLDNNALSDEEKK